MFISYTQHASLLKYIPAVVMTLFTYRVELFLALSLLAKGCLSILHHCVFTMYDKLRCLYVAITKQTA